MSKNVWRVVLPLFVAVNAVLASVNAMAGNYATALFNGVVALFTAFAAGMWFGARS